MSLINQPFDGQLGDMLIEKLREDYNRLTIVVAFARNSGVLRLKPELERFRANGGSVHLFVGVDMEGTTYEALLNLLPLCDTLHIVHSENPATTFHSKIFILENNNEIWSAIGSNNLTAGGLWTNFESFHSQTLEFGTPECDAVYRPFSALIAMYSDADYECTFRIENIEDINDLDREGYVVREGQHRIRQNEERARRITPGGRRLFGISQRAPLPRVPEDDSTEIVIPIGPETTVNALYMIDEHVNNERIWFETRRMTGGSRNILDLSMLGTLIQGSGAGSRYETDDARYVLGGVSFFDVRPGSTTSKSITINYNGIDYSPCQIEFTPNNGSWRIHINGRSTVDGSAIHNAAGRGWLTRKILIFEKICTDYYTLSALEADDISTCRLASHFVARNGTASGSKEFGLLNP
jgi:hypothetical protein